MLVRSGGPFALTATFLSDSRFVFRKLALVFGGARKLQRYDAADSIEAIYREASTKRELKTWSPRCLQRLSIFRWQLTI